jgi:hypothetical protein
LSISSGFRTRSDQPPAQRPGDSGEIEDTFEIAGAPGRARVQRQQIGKQRGPGRQRPKRSRTEARISVHRQQQLPHIRRPEGNTPMRGLIEIQVARLERFRQSLRLLKGQGDSVSGDGVD